LSYDAWGRLRHSFTQQVYAPDATPALLLGRGYTGHEHLPWFGLINMNARLYDPVVGRFLSPDPYVQAPDFSQNFNRYSYALNNPLKYTDPDGEFFFIDSFIAGFIKGLVKGNNVFKEGWNSVKNDAKFWGGLFVSDPNKSFGGRVWEVLSRFTWQLPQTLVGFSYAQVSNLAGQVDKVEYWGGATVSSGHNWGSGAVTMGSYITGNRNIKADPNNYLFQHEYGHYLQSQEMGPAYLSRVGIPSLMSAFHKDGNHIYQPFEQDANRRAFLYFNENVEGFYQTEAEYRYNQLNGIEKGWNFYDNPLDVNHIGYFSRWYYYDYKNAAHLELINSLTLKAKWYDYLDPVGLFVGIGNGLYYNKHRVK
jgi:RHS repeat-associated protein